MMEEDDMAKNELRDTIIELLDKLDNRRMELLYCFLMGLVNN